MDASMDKAKLVELENQYTQLYVGEMEGERGERSCMLERWRERGGEKLYVGEIEREGGEIEEEIEKEGGENQYTQLYVREMEGERGER